MPRLHVTNCVICGPCVCNRCINYMRVRTSYLHVVVLIVGGSGLTGIGAPQRIRDAKQTSRHASQQANKQASKQLASGALFGLAADQRFALVVFLVWGFGANKHRGPAMYYYDSSAWNAGGNGGGVRAMYLRSARSLH